MPLSKFNEIKPLVRNGADEFFLGFSPKKASDVNCLNLRPYDDANFTDLRDLIKVLRAIKIFNKKSYLCLNKDFYSDDEIREIDNILEHTFCYLSGVIICDFVLIGSIRHTYPKLKIIISTRGKVLNSESVKFYSSIGAKRITLPIDLSIKEIKMIVSNRDFNNLEFEVFIKNESCKNINGLCGLTHNLFENKQKGLVVFCKYPRIFKPLFKNGNSFEYRKIKNYFDNLNHDYDCGICKMKELYNIGIKKFKIAGRNLSFDKKLKILYFTTEARKNIYKKNKSFKKRMRFIYKSIYNQDCDFHCLYKN